MASSSYCTLIIKLNDGSSFVWSGEDGDSPLFTVPERAAELLAKVNSVESLKDFILKRVSAVDDPEYAKELYLSRCKEFDDSLSSVSAIEDIRSFSLEWAEYDPSDGLPPEVGCEAENLEYVFASKTCTITDEPDPEFIEDLYDFFGDLFF